MSGSKLSICNISDKEFIPFFLLINLNFYVLPPSLKWRKTFDITETDYIKSSSTFVEYCFEQLVTFQLIDILLQEKLCIIKIRPCMLHWGWKPRENPTLSFVRKCFRVFWLQRKWMMYGAHWLFPFFLSESCKSLDLLKIITCPDLCRHKNIRVRRFIFNNYLKQETSSSLNSLSNSKSLVKEAKIRKVWLKERKENGLELHLVLFQELELTEFERTRWCGGAGAAFLGDKAKRCFSLFWRRKLGTRSARNSRALSRSQFRRN